jgi:hypothetical protein
MKYRNKIGGIREKMEEKSWEMIPKKEDVVVQIVVY